MSCLARVSRRRGASRPAALVLGYGLPFEHELPAAVALLAEAVEAGRSGTRAARSKTRAGPRLRRLTRAIPICERQTEERMTDGNGVGVLELRVVVTAPDYNAALRFYRDILGLRERAAFSSEGGRVSILEAGAREHFELADPQHAAFIDEVEVGERVAGHIRLAFGVADTDGATAAAVEGDAGA